jgi:hypothetical protein
MVMQEIAITAFVDKGLHFIDEVNQMTLSGKNLDERFVFVIFAEHEIASQIKKRHNVLVYKYSSPKNIYYENYRYAKSLEFIVSNKHILNKYKYLIKTDTDVFVTSNLNNYIFSDKISFREGFYSLTDKCIEETYEMANKFGYPEYKKLFNAGATLIGLSDDVINIVSRSDALCKKIFFELCPDGDFGGTLDRTWTKSLYAGTSTLIATEIVLSSLFDIDKFITTDSIDANCFSTDTLDGIFHIHQWHGDGVYSKFQARDGMYDNLKPLDNNTISDYCLKIFLENKKEKNG